VVVGSVITLPPVGVLWLTVTIVSSVEEVTAVSIRVLSPFIERSLADSSSAEKAT